MLSSDGKKLTKYRVDPNTGQITAATNQPFEKVFTRLKPTSIQNAPTSLTRAITAAEQRAGGKATDAAVDRDGDQVQYTVKVAKADGTTEKLRVNGAHGKVASAICMLFCWCGLEAADGSGFSLGGLSLVCCCDVTCLW